MEVGGRNKKWLGTRDRRTVGVVGFNILFKFSAGVPQCGRGMDAFIVIDVIECRT